jgi:hypothetical protein
MTLEEYEAQLAEKKAALNKAKQVKELDTSEFENMKQVVKAETPEDVGLELSQPKEKKGPKAKERKEVSGREKGLGSFSG